MELVARHEAEHARILGTLALTFDSDSPRHQPLDFRATSTITAFRECEINETQTGLRTFKRYYQEQIIFCVAYRENTWGPKRTPKRRRFSSEDESYYHKTKYEGAHPTV